MTVLGSSLKYAEHRKRIYPFSATVISGLLVLTESLTIISIGTIVQSIIVGWPADTIDDYLFAISFIFLCTILLLGFAGQYRFEAYIKPLENADKLVVACLTAFLILLAIAFSLKVSDTFSRRWMYFYAFSSTAAILVIRIVLATILTRLAAHGVLARNVIVLGSGPQAVRLLKRIAEDEPPFIIMIGVFDPDGNELDEIEGVPVRGNLEDLVSFVREHDVDDVIVAEPWNEEQRIVDEVEKLLELPTNIYLASDLIGFRYYLRPPDDNFALIPVSELAEKPLPGWAWLLKYLEDKILSVLLLIVFSPVMLLTAIAVKIDSPGPVLYRQERFGFNNRRFSIYKFRSMRHSESSSDGTPQATADDPRVTRVGWFIRRTSIDELPQLLNVLGGTMSLIGPRPHAVDHNEEYSRKIRGYFARHRVKPGITGWAQVNGYRGETSDIADMEARVRHDVYYSQRWSLFFDLKILLMTAWIVISGKNAY